MKGIIQVEDEEILHKTVFVCIWFDPVWKILVNLKNQLKLINENEGIQKQYIVIIGQSKNDEEQCHCNIKHT